MTGGTSSNSYETVIYGKDFSIKSQTKTISLSYNEKDGLKITLSGALENKKTTDITVKALVDGKLTDLPITLTAGSKGIFTVSEADLVGGLSKIGTSFSSVEDLNISIDDSDSKIENNPYEMVETPRDLVVTYDQLVGVSIELNGSLSGRTKSDITIKAVIDKTETPLTVSWNKVGEKVLPKQ